MSPSPIEPATAHSMEVPKKQAMFSVSEDRGESGKHAVLNDSNDDGLATDAPKSYSRASVWLMILYSGLAIGSDG
jgi:hypothetical protein